MNTTSISGKATFQNIGPGFWGIIGLHGEKWRPVNMPEQLKEEGKQVTVKVVEVENDFSIEMWGTPVKILSFET